jgi:hypothetical protein
MTTTLKTKDHDVQSINILASPKKVFDFVANPHNLPVWTAAFKKADDKSAVLATPKGEVQIALETRVNEVLGTIDWYMTLPDGSVGAAYSRIIPSTDGYTIYSFVLLAPPVPIEQIEGALAEQKVLLKKELLQLQSILSE